jgi:hypothetical protein
VACPNTVVALEWIGMHLQQPSSQKLPMHPKSLFSNSNNQTINQQHLNRLTMVMMNRSEVQCMVHCCCSGIDLPGVMVIYCDFEVVVPCGLLLVVGAPIRVVEFGVIMFAMGRKYLSKKKKEKGKKKEIPVLNLHSCQGKMICHNTIN